MNILTAPALGVAGLIVAFIVFRLVMRYSDGTDQVKKIGDEIHKGAMKFMKTEYTYLLIFVVCLGSFSRILFNHSISYCCSCWCGLLITGRIYWNVCCD